MVKKFAIVLVVCHSHMNQDLTIQHTIALLLAPTNVLKIKKCMLLNICYKKEKRENIFIFYLIFIYV